MSEETLPGLEPVRKSVTVNWGVEAAFRRFTTDIAKWWPLRSHSVGNANALKVVFEDRVGGKIYEVSRDGARSDWGTILAWDPPNRVEFTWHPGSDAAESTRVELRFQAEPGGGTRLELTHRDWHRLGAMGGKARRGYNSGWVYVLQLWADRRYSPSVLFFNVLLVVIGPFLRWKWERERRAAQAAQAAARG